MKNSLSLTRVCITSSSPVRNLTVIAFLLLLPITSFAQTMQRYTTKELELLYFGKRYSYLMPHAVLTFHNALAFHEKQWNYNHKKTYVLLSDFEDDGHGGAITAPHNMIFIGIAPFNFAFSITPSNERFQWLFSHELTHVALTDNPNNRDQFWRKAFAGKVSRSALTPVSGIWSYLTTPRWYAPRWFHEGIACYTETWTSGGIGRSMGPYDEMYFRSIVREKLPLYSVIGLDTEGTVVDFQVGANSYLYGTRFITYLGQQYGDSYVRKLYTRSNDSRASYAGQFKKVFGKSLYNVWNEWIDFENNFQNQNLQRICQFPVTPFRPLSLVPMGSMSSPGYDPVNNKMYVAINHPGQLSHIAELDLTTGKQRKVATVESPMLYSVTFLTYNPDSSQIYITEHNTKYRNLVQIDANTGKKKELIRNARVSNITYDRANAVIWGVRQDNGFSTIVKIPAPYNQVIPLYTADFGRSLLDLSVSGDGSKLSATVTGIKGEQLLVLFNTNTLETGSKVFDTIYRLDDNSLTQFRFSSDDKYLIGTSYYTGVSNIWRISLADKSFELLSNDETGLFTPQQISPDSLYVLKYHRDGMTPGIIPVKVLEDANAIEYLANRVVDREPVVKSYTLKPASRLNLDSLTISETPYRPIKHMRLSNAWPDIAGYKNSVAVGYRVSYSDMSGLAGLNLFVATSPWSTFEDKQKLHADLQFNLWRWSFRATWNKTHFYDLFGPTHRSRAGYSAGVSYKFDDQRASPFKRNAEISFTHFGDLEVLPQFQNIDAPLRSFQAFSAENTLSKLRRTLGAVEDERGWIWKLTGTGYLAEGSIFPSLITEQSIGMLIPRIRNTSFWIRNSIGQSFGKYNSPFSDFYFGSFRNNYVDWQPADQYRTLIAFPGVEIDEIPAYNFIKTMGELNLRPIRFRNAGTTWLYPTFLKTSLFATHLATEPDRSTNRNMYNAGIQIDLEVVLLSYLKTTWSAGYARKFEHGSGAGEEWMISLKLLD